jgi:type I restriction enzyme S subunit
MADANKLVTNNIDVWTSAIKKRNSQGRGSSKKIELTGIKKLRGLIVDLAVRGKLVPQDLSDEPASVLLKNITEKKSKLIEDSIIKKPKTLPIINEEEKTFKIPSNWEWIRLGDVTNYGTSEKVEPNNVEPSTWVLELEDVEKETSKLLKKVRFQERQFKSSKNSFFKGDVIYGKLRPYLDKVLVANEDGVCTTEMIPVRAYSSITSDFLRLLMKSPSFIDYANNSTHGMNLPRMGTDKARLAVLSLPPIKEQHRIVAKVDELMLLCDDLEQQSEESISAHQTLVKVLLSTLTNPTQAASDTADTFQQNWQRIAEHFDVLFATEHSIEQLKQTILQLAVMGKLVPQNSKDEPVSVLLKIIAKEKEQLIKDKKINRQKSLPKVDDSEKYCVLPPEWEWVRLDEVLQVISDYHANGSYKILKENVELLDNEDFAIMLRTTNFSQSNYSNYKYINEHAYHYLTKSKIYGGDIIMNKIGDPGASFYVDDRGKPMSLAMNLFLLRTQTVNSKFVYLYLKSNYEYIKMFANGTSTQTITKDAVYKLPFPLCPLREQEAILEKVDELMVLCDQLKSRLGDANITQLQLADTIVAQAVN